MRTSKWIFVAVGVLLALINVVLIYRTYEAIIDFRESDEKAKILIGTGLFFSIILILIVLTLDITYVKLLLELLF